jgi:hypothetical protein
MLNWYKIKSIIIIILDKSFAPMPHGVNPW